MTRRRLALISGVMLLLASCATSPAASPGVRVLAVESWMADIAQNVAGNRAHVDSLLPAGVDPHEFQPAPLDTIKIARSQVLIVNGLDYESWLSAALQDAGGQRVLVTATDGLVEGAATPTPEPDTGLQLFPFLGGTPAPAGEAIDPHAWMDPNNVVRYVGNIRDGLTRADPAGKDVYDANAAAYIDKLHALDASIKSQVEQIPPARRLLVTNHDALGYFARAYGFRVVGNIIPSVTAESSPSAQQMTALIETINQTGAPVVFLDVSENPNLAEQVASSTHARIVTDLYVETLSAPDGPAPTYIDMLQHDASLIAKALK